MFVLSECYNIWIVNLTSIEKQYRVFCSNFFPDNNELWYVLLSFCTFVNKYNLENHLGLLVRSIFLGRIKLKSTIHLKHRNAK